MLSALVQETTQQVATDSGAVGVIGFFIVCVIAVIVAARYRKRRG